MLNNRWFEQSIQPVTGSSSNERFAERLNNVWFKKPVGLIRLGLFLTKLAERVTALEQASKTTHPVPPMRHGGRTATGVAAMNQNWRLPYGISLVANAEEATVLRAVRLFKENNSNVWFVNLDGYQIKIKRDPNV